MHLKILIWAEVHRLYQVLSESWAQNNCPVSVVTSLKMKSAWSQSWVFWFSNPDNFTKLPGRRRTGISWEQREKSGASQFVLGVKKLLEVLGMMWFWAPLPAVLFLRPRVQLPPLTNSNGDGESHYYARDPCYTQLSLRKHRIFLRGALVFPKDAEPGQANRWRQSDTFSSSHLSVEFGRESSDWSLGSPTSEMVYFIENMNWRKTVGVLCHLVMSGVPPDKMF